MCKLLGISYNSYYAYQEPQASSEPFVVKIFHENHRVYDLAKLGYCVSRRGIGRIIAKNGLISAYTPNKYRLKSTVNYENVINLVNRQFDQKQQYEVLVSDLTCVRGGSQRNYICILLDLSNREIVGYSCGKYKDAKLDIACTGQCKNQPHPFSNFPHRPGQ